MELNAVPVTFRAVSMAPRLTHGVYVVIVLTDLRPQIFMST
jgi:hypothetical protein